MSLSDLASLGSFVSGVAVLGSLIFLYHQLRQIGAQIKQAEKNQMASIRAERTSRTLANIHAFAEPSAVDAMYKGIAGDNDMSPTQVRQFQSYCLARFYNMEDAYSQHAEGLLDESAYANMKASLRIGFSTPGFRAGWRVVRNQFDADGGFVAYIDGLLAETPLAYVSPAALWAEAFAAERSAAAGGS